MTVRCLSPEQKKLLIRRFYYTKDTLTDIASAFGVSRRTVSRVVKEYCYYEPISLDLEYQEHLRQKQKHADTQTHT